MIFKQTLCSFVKSCNFTTFRYAVCQYDQRTTVCYRQHFTRMVNRSITTGPQLTVRPEGSLLVDDKLELKIVGLEKQQKTTVHAVIKEGITVFESCCCFTADDDGEVDLATQPSVAGSYTGVSPMGIFWSMVQAPGQREGLRLMKKDLNTPMTTNIAVYDDHLCAESIREVSPDPICLASVDRWYKAPGVRRQMVRDGKIRGVLYIPPGDGPFPGVIDLFGTAGGVIEFRSALLASRGFASLSLPYFRYEDLPDSMFDLHLEYFMEAIDWMCSQDVIFSDGLGVVGVSKGGDLALMMAAHSPKVSCVVNINGCTFAATYGMQFKGGYIPPVQLQLDKMYEEEGAIVTKDCLEYTKEDLTPVNMLCVSPMGIFWSMVQAPGQREGLRLMKKDLNTPMTTNIAVYDDHLCAESIREVSPDPICLASVDRWYKAPGVRRQMVRDGKIRGVLYIPPGDGPFPGVIDLFGTAGGVIEFRSALLASRGFASLSLPYFRYEDLPDSMFDLHLEYFMEAIDWMCSQDVIFSDGLGVVGVSKGGDLALMMAAHSPKVSCVVNINGCTFAATYGMQFKGGYIPPVQLQLDKMYEEEGAIVTKDCLEYTKEDLTPVWNSHAKVLNIIGEDDKCGPNQCIHFMKEHYPPEKTDNFEIVSYPLAGHLIEPPYTPLCRMSYHKTFDIKFLWGGYPEPHAIAQEDSWKRIQEHLHKYIPRTSTCDSVIGSKL